MAKDEKPADKSNDPSLFRDAIKVVKSETYLGNKQMVESILRTGMERLHRKLLKATDSTDQEQALRWESEHAADIFLGKRKEFTPVYNWNEPGMIDVFIAKWVGSTETDPKQRVAHGVLAYFLEMIELADTAGQDGIRNEQVEWQFDAITDKYAKLFIGLNPATDQMME